MTKQKDLHDMPMGVLYLGIPFMKVGWYLFLMSSAVYFLVSLSTPAPEKTQLRDLCWTRPLDSLRGKMQGITDPRIMAGILFVIMIVLYVILH